MYLTVSSWLLISFVIEGSRTVMLLNRTGGVVWAPKSHSYPLRGQVGGGWALEIESFFGSCVPVYIKLPMRLWFLSSCTEWFLMHAIYAPMIYTDSCVMFLMHAGPLWEQVGGGLALEISSFWAPNGTRLLARWHFTGPKKLLISRAWPPPTCPRNVSSIKNIMHGAI
jgi:hypothetical protein